jgi:hypothetical protein
LLYLLGSGIVHALSKEIQLLDSEVVLYLDKLSCPKRLQGFSCFSVKRGSEFYGRIDGSNRHQ